MWLSLTPLFRFFFCIYLLCCFLLAGSSCFFFFFVSSISGDVVVRRLWFLVYTTGEGHDTSLSLRVWRASVEFLEQIRKSLLFHVTVIEWLTPALSFFFFFELSSLWGQFFFALPPGINKYDDWPSDKDIHKGGFSICRFSCVRSTFFLLSSFFYTPKSSVSEQLFGLDDCYWWNELLFYALHCSGLCLFVHMLKIRSVWCVCMCVLLFRFDASSSSSLLPVFSTSAFPPVSHFPISLYEPDLRV